MTPQDVVEMVSCKKDLAGGMKRLMIFLATPSVYILVEMVVQPMIQHIMIDYQNKDLVAVSLTIYFILVYWMGTYILL